MNPANRLLLGGFLTLAVVMGVGRFLYTPLLPLMQRDYGFGPDIAGVIAAANFAGYLAGSILASFVPAGPMRHRALQLGLVASVATTLGMGLTDDFSAWLALRAVSGIASAFAMIAAAGIIAEALARIGAEAKLGWVLGGVGTGIALSGLMVHAATPALDASGLWIVAGLACLPLVPVIIAEVRDRQLPAQTRQRDPRRRVPRPLPFWPLLVNYTCEGLGYSVFATFIVAIVKSRPGLAEMGDWVWIMVGLAGLPSCLVWSRIAERIGFSTALACAYGAQILGVMLPVLSSSAPAAILAALLFGGTFMAITVLTMPLGRHGLGGRGFAVLTAGFGLGQMLGPLFAGFLVAGEADYNLALTASAAVLAFGLAALLFGIRLRPTPA